MEHTQAMSALPEVYRIALELRDAGTAITDIAARLDVDISAIDSLLAIGDEKLARLLQAEPVACD